MGFQESGRSGPSGTQTSTAEPEKGSVSVEISGQRLSIRSDKDPAFVRKLAGYVDEKVSSLQKAAPAVSLDKLLILASMTIAEELFESKQETERIRKDIGERVQQCLALIDEVEVEAEAESDAS